MMEVSDVEERRPLLQSSSGVSGGECHEDLTENCEDSLGFKQFYFLSVYQKLSNCFHRNVWNRDSLEKIIVGISAFLANAILFGFRSCLSIYLVEFKNAFPSQDQLVSLAVFLPTGIYGIVGVLTGCFNSRYGVRSTALLGSVLLSLGVGISVFVSSVVYLIVYLGLLAGSGTSFIFIAINCGIASYFDQSCKQLMSLISTGGAVGAIIFPIFISKLTQLYSWRGSLLILCALTMHSVPCGLLYSLKKLPKRGEPSVSNEVGNDSCSSGYQSTDRTPQEHFESPKKTKFDLDPVSNDTDESDSKPQMEAAQETDGTNASSRHENDKHLNGVDTYQSNDRSCHEEQTDTKLGLIRMLCIILNSNTYLLLLLSTIGAVSFIMSFAIILPDYLVNRGMTLEESTRIFVIASIGNIPARFISCWLLYKNIASSIMIFNLSGLIGAILALLYPYLVSTSMLISLSFMIFLASGMGLSVFSVTFLEIFENKLYSCALGFAMTLSGLGLPFSGYIISVLKDRYESYVPCYHFLSLLCCVTIVPSVIHSLVIKWKRNPDSVV